MNYIDVYKINNNKNKTTINPVLRGHHWDKEKITL